MALQQFLVDDYSQPSRTDYYLMQIAQEVRRVLAKHPRRVKIDDFTLDFSDSEKPESKLTKEQRAAMAKSRWFGMTGAKRDG